MNAGRDVERLIAGWLAEEAPGHAPDRILAEAGRTVDRTKQRRFTAAWREPMIISTGRLVAAAALVVAAVLGAGWLGRSTASVGQAGPAATPSAGPSAGSSPEVTVGTFRTARDAICTAAMSTGQALNRQLDGLYDPALTTAQRAAKIDALRQIVSLAIDLRRQLAAIPVPPEMAADQAAALARGEDVQAVLVSEIALLEQGKLSEARSLDQVTDPINRDAEAFEQKYHLAPCP